LMPRGTHARAGHVCACLLARSRPLARATAKPGVVWQNDRRLRWVCTRSATRQAWQLVGTCSYACQLLEWEAVTFGAKPRPVPLHLRSRRLRTREMRSCPLGHGEAQSRSPANPCGVELSTICCQARLAPKTAVAEFARPDDLPTPIGMAHEHRIVPLRYSVRVGVC